MTAYILIVMWSAAGGQTAVSMQEFTTLTACQFASIQIHKKKPTESPPSMVCVPKELK